MTAAVLDRSPTSPPPAAPEKPEERREPAGPFALFVGAGKECTCIAAGPDLEVGRRLLAKTPGGLLLKFEEAEGYYVGWPGRVNSSPARELQARVAEAVECAPCAAVAKALPAPTPAPVDKLVRAEAARLQGYTGDSCETCGNFTMVRNGTCLKCNSCGSTSGCS